MPHTSVDEHFAKIKALSDMLSNRDSLPLEAFFALKILVSRLENTHKTLTKGYGSKIGLNDILAEIAKVAEESGAKPISQEEALKLSDIEEAQALRLENGIFVVRFGDVYDSFKKTTAAKLDPSDEKRISSLFVAAYDPKTGELALPENLRGEKNIVDILSFVKDEAKIAKAWGQSDFKNRFYEALAAKPELKPKFEEAAEGKATKKHIGSLPFDRLMEIDEKIGLNALKDAMERGGYTIDERSLRVPTFRLPRNLPRDHELLDEIAATLDAELARTLASALGAAGNIASFGNADLIDEAGADMSVLREAAVVADAAKAAKEPLDTLAKRFFEKQKTRYIEENARRNFFGATFSVKFACDIQRAAPDTLKYDIDKKRLASEAARFGLETEESVTIRNFGVADTLRQAVARIEAAQSVAKKSTEENRALVMARRRFKSPFV